MTTPFRLPWAAMLRFGLFGLRLTPDAFWKLSLREFALLAAGQVPVPPLGRAELDELMAEFPDN